MKRYNAISLFSGAGGFDLGMETAGFTTRLCTDVDFHSCQTLTNNKEALLHNPKFHFLKDAKIVQKDIREYPTSQMLLDAGLNKEDVSVIYGGPPCQSFSVFGQRKGMQDPRGTLLWEYLRVIRDVEPSCFVFENVAGLLTIDEGAVFRKFKRELMFNAKGEKTYHVVHYLLNVASYGVPEYRTRVIIYGSKGINVPCPIKTHSISLDKIEDGLLPAVTVRQAISGLPDPKLGLVPNHVGRAHGAAVMERYSALKYGERDSKTRINRLDPDKPSFTIVVGSDKGGGKGHVHPFEPREVTPRESARIQTFPDFWVFSGTSRHPIRQIGNAVPPVFAAVLGANLLRFGFGESDVPDYQHILDKLGLEYLKV